MNDVKSHPKGEGSSAVFEGLIISKKIQDPFDLIKSTRSPTTGRRLLFYAGLWEQSVQVVVVKQ